MDKISKIIIGIVVAGVLLLGVVILVQQVSEESDTKRAKVAADEAEWKLNMDNKITGEEADIIEMEIGQTAATCYVAANGFRATAGKWDPTEMVKNCDMSAAEAKRESVRWQKILDQNETARDKATADEAKRQQSELSKLKR